MIALAPRTFRACLHVALAIRARDRIEIAATRGWFDAEALADSFLHADDGAVCEIAGRPVAMAAMQRTAMARVATIGLVATDALSPRASLFLADAARTLLPALMRERGLNRLEARSLADYAAAHRWMERMGATRECALPGMGANGETFVQYAWVSPDVRFEPVRPEPAETARPV